MWVSVGCLIWATVQFQPVRQNINLTTDLALTKEMKKGEFKSFLKGCNQNKFYSGVHQVNKILLY